MSAVNHGPDCVSRERQIFLPVGEQASTVLERNMDTAGLRRWGWHSQSSFKGLYTIFAVIRHRNWWGEKLARSRIWDFMLWKERQEMRGISWCRHRWCVWLVGQLGWAGLLPGRSACARAWQCSPNPVPGLWFMPTPRCCPDSVHCQLWEAVHHEASLVKRGHVWNTALFVAEKNRLHDFGATFLELQI